MVIHVQHGEIGFELHQFGMKAQDAAADGVEGAEPWHAFDRLAEHMAEAFLHFPRRLVGEGDGEDFVGPRASRGQNVRDARGEHTGLAGARTGQHQHRTVQRFHGVALLGIERGQILWSGGRAGTRSNAASGGLVVWHVAGQVSGRQLVRFGHAIRLWDHDGTSERDQQKWRPVLRPIAL